MTKRRKRRLPPKQGQILSPTDAVQRVLGELLGEVQNTLVHSVQNLFLPPPQFRETRILPAKPQPPVIKDAEVISIRTTP